MRFIKSTALALAFVALASIVSITTPGGKLFAQALMDSIAWRSTGHLVYSSTAPTVTSAGTSPSVTASNGSSTFIVNVGTGGSATAIVMAMPTATAGWTCQVADITANAAATANVSDRQTASTTTSVTVQHYTVSTGAVVAYSASDLVRFICAAY